MYTAQGRQDISKDAKKAIVYYLQTAKLGHPTGLSEACHLAEKENSAQGYWLISQYHHQKAAYTDAVNWGLLAAERHTPEALVYLNETNFKAGIDYAIAGIYENGSDKIKANFNRCLDFYKRAEMKGHPQAAFRLAEFYEDGLKIAQNYSSALTYFISAAEKGHLQGLSRALALVKTQNNGELYYRISRSLTIRPIMTRHLCITARR